jgi:hypothetical protein
VNAEERPSPFYLNTEEDSGICEKSDILWPGWQPKGYDDKFYAVLYQNNFRLLRYTTPINVSVSIETFIGSIFFNIIAI